MYYETREHELVPVKDANEAATLIKEGKFQTYQALIWKVSETESRIVVADGHVDEPFVELAVIKETTDGDYLQIETITNAWVETAEELAKSFNEANYPMGKANLTIGKAEPSREVWFTCGCCGTGFKGILAYQLKFDQDNGYGICKGCEKYYI